MQFAHALPEQQLQIGQYDNMRRTELFKLACAKGLLESSQPTPTKDVLKFMLEAQTTLPKAQFMAGEQSVPLNVADDPVALKEHIAKLQAKLDEVEEKDSTEVAVDNLQKMTEFLGLGSPDGRGQVMAMKSFLKKECGIEMPNGSTKEDCVAKYEEYLDAA